MSVDMAAVQLLAGVVCSVLRKFQEKCAAGGLVGLVPDGVGWLGAAMLLVGRKRQP